MIKLNVTVNVLRLTKYNEMKYESLHNTKVRCPSKIDVFRLEALSPEPVHRFCQKHRTWIITYPRGSIPIKEKNRSNFLSLITGSSLERSVNLDSD